MAQINVLIVDDEIELVETLVERLALRGFSARGTCSGEEAVDLVQTESFQVVLLDVKMPGMGGLEVLKSMKQVMPDQKVVLLTGHGSRNDSDQGIRLGAFDYLMKPVKIDDLVSILKRAVAEGEDR